MRRRITAPIERHSELHRRAVARQARKLQRATYVPGSFVHAEQAQALWTPGRVELEALAIVPDDQLQLVAPASKLEGDAARFGMGRHVPERFLRDAINTLDDVGRGIVQIGRYAATHGDAVLSFEFSARTLECDPKSRMTENAWMEVMRQLSDPVCYLDGPRFQALDIGSEVGAVADGSLEAAQPDGHRRELLT